MPSDSVGEDDIGKGSGNMNCPGIGEGDTGVAKMTGGLSEARLSPEGCERPGWDGGMDMGRECSNTEVFDCSAGLELAAYGRISMSSRYTKGLSTDLGC